MSRELKHVQTLVYYDGPQLIVAADSVGTEYLCMLTEELEDRDKFLCAAISSSRLSDFKKGVLDLLHIFANPETGELYEGDAGYSVDELSLATKLVEQPPESWYPQEGFYLDPEDEAITEARARNRAVINFALNPPETRDALQIDVDRLADGLHIFQNLVKHAYNKSMSGLNKAGRELVPGSINYQMEVYGFSTGSFTVNMQSKLSSDDLLGGVNIEKALRLVDEAVAASSNSEEAIRFLREHSGFFLSAYRSLLKFVIDNDSPLEYVWATPGLVADERSTMSVEVAHELYDLLVSQESLETEFKTLVGVVTAARYHNGTWTLRSEKDDIEYSGKVKPESPINLAGITLYTERYQFECEERLQESIATGQERVERFLLSYKKL